MSIVQILFSPNGRLRRRDFWLYSIGLRASQILLHWFVYKVVLDLPSENLSKDINSHWRFETTPFSLYLWCTTLLTFWPGLCLTIKRFHDRNRSGWLAVGIVAFNWTLAMLLQQIEDKTSSANYALLGLSLAVSLWCLVDLGILDGTKGRNKYGPSPKGTADQAEVF